MPAPTKVQLTGGHFQDAEGNVLNLGYLLMEVVQDEQLSSLAGQVCSGIKIKITLNASGSVDVTTPQSVWSPENMVPAGASYTVWGYTALGQLAWGPNYGLDVPIGATFDVDNWIPNTTGGGSGSTGGITLQTNEVNNGSQQLLDLHAGSNITLTDNGSGQVTIAASGSAALVLQTNEVPNGSQTLLDLHAGTGITLVDNGSGKVTIAASVVSVDCMFSTGIVDWFNVAVSGSGTDINDAAFQISAFKFSLVANLNPITKITAQVTSPNPPQQWGAAIYDKNGNLVWQSGPLVVFVSGYTLTSWTVPSLTLPAGEYYLALSQDSHSFGGIEMNQTFSGWEQLAVDPSNAPPGTFNSGVPVLVGVAANPTTSGVVFPATLGAVTPYTVANNWGLPVIKFGN